jgi:hypothetical protein
MFTNMEVRLERAGHCQRCEFYRRATKQCTQCGCLVNLKVTIADEECPAGKWGRVEPGTDFMSTMASKVQEFLKPKK